MFIQLVFVGDVHYKPYGLAYTESVTSLPLGFQFLIPMYVPTLYSLLHFYYFFIFIIIIVIIVVVTGFIYFSFKGRFLRESGVHV